MRYDVRGRVCSRERLRRRGVLLIGGGAGEKGDFSTAATIYRSGAAVTYNSAMGRPINADVGVQQNYNPRRPCDRTPCKRGRIHLAVRERRGRDVDVLVRSENGLLGRI